MRREYRPHTTKRHRPPDGTPTGILDRTDPSAEQVSEHGSRNRHVDIQAKDVGQHWNKYNTADTDRPDQNTDNRGDHCCKNYRCGGQHGINFTQFLVSIKQTTSISGALAPYAQGGAMVDGEGPIVCVDTVLVRSG